jgi:hypothetical protein
VSEDAVVSGAADDAGLVVGAAVLAGVVLDDAVLAGDVVPADFVSLPHAVMETTAAPHSAAALMNLNMLKILQKLEDKMRFETRTSLT